MSQNNPQKIHAPYNFVPLSAWIYEPDWAKRVSHDVPFSDGINGELKIRITAHSPILVGGKQNPSDGTSPGEVHFFQPAPGDYRIPGSSLKGTIRAMMSIVTFGKMRQVDDQWLSIRDLTSGVSEIYGKRMSEPIEGKLTPKARAGYLRLAEEGDTVSWEIVPCEYLRVEHDDLEKLGRGRGIANVGRIRNRQGAKEKYHIWGDDLDVSFKKKRIHECRQTKQATPEHKKAHDLDDSSNTRFGRIVFTGQPQANKPGKKFGGNQKNKPKHLEFVFYEPREADPLPVDEEVIRAFLHIHEETEEWKFHRKRMNQHLGVPVFYLESGRFPTAIGLAMMFRLPYTKSIGQAVDNTNYHHRDSETLGLPDLLFGHINENESGMASRVSFSMARLVGKPQLAKPFTTILNGPKPSYFPAYINQEVENNGQLKVRTSKTGHQKTGQIYNTLMDEDCYIRGWKRYPARSHIHLPQHPQFDRDQPPYNQQNRHRNDEPNAKVHNKLHPLAAGSVFEGSIRLHNVRPEELGALVWCLSWGGNPDLRHGLGMGKPLGMGQVSFEIDLPESKLTINHGQLPNYEECITRFEEMMEREYSLAAKKMGVRWRDSEQMVQLLAMADPMVKPIRSGPLKHMRLEKRGPNDFQHFKGRTIHDPRFALLSYVPFDGEADRNLFDVVPKPEKPQVEKQPEQPLKFKPSQRSRAESAEQIRKEKLLAKLPELEREVVVDLEKHGEKQVQDWIKEMEQREIQEAVQIARALANFFQPQPKKWTGKLSPKQAKKVARIKEVLVKGGEHVPE
jgi:CRISPR-associated protein (TIGR03986 family)